MIFLGPSSVAYWRSWTSTWTQKLNSMIDYQNFLTTWSSSMIRSLVWKCPGKHRQLFRYLITPGIWCANTQAGVNSYCYLYQDIVPRVQLGQFTKRTHCCTRIKPLLFSHWFESYFIRSIYRFRGLSIQDGSINIALSSPLPWGRYSLAALGEN